MRIIFVGMHNKPGKLLLDSSTMTGKIIDKIIEKMQFDCIKTNLCDTDYFVKDFAELNQQAINWHKKYNPCPEDIIVLLGRWVQKNFWYDNLQTISITHPAGIYGTKNKDEYVIKSYNLIIKKVYQKPK